MFTLSTKIVLDCCIKVVSLATRITVICTEKTDKITYVLLVNIVTDESINSLNFYR